MITTFQGSEAAYRLANPYAIDVLRTKRKDLVHGIVHTAELLDQLVAEDVMTTKGRATVLAMKSLHEQNSRILEVIEANGERACRRFIHPCLTRAEPDLYFQIREYVTSLNERTRDTGRQLIGYLLEQDHNFMSKVMTTRGSCGSNAEVVLERGGFDQQLEPAQIQPDITLSDDVIGNTANTNDETPIHKESACLESVLGKEGMTLLKGGSEDDGRAEGGLTLHRAARDGDWQQVERLLQDGAEIQAKDDENKTALFYAAAEGHEKAAAALLKAGAKADGEIIDEAAKLNHRSLLKIILDRGRGAVSEEDLNAAVFSAVRQNKHEALSALIDGGASVDICDEQGYTPLLLCAETGHSEAFRCIQGFILTPRHTFGKLLEQDMAALGRGLGDCLLKTLLMKVTCERFGQWNADFRRWSSTSVMSLGFTKSVLIEKQAILKTTLPNRSSVLHLAVRGGCVSIVEKLLERGLDPDTTGPKAQTPLHLAAASDTADIVKSLLKAGAQVNATAQDGATPLHVACKHGHKEIVACLTKNKVKVEAVDKQGRTALHWAAVAPDESGVVDELLAAKVDVNALDNEKRSALHLAAMEGKLQTVVSLLSNKGKAGAKDKNGSTAMHYAADGGHADVVSALLQAQKKKGLEERNTWKKTPLHVAAEKGQGSVVALLLEAGARINAKDQNKETALHCAVRVGHPGAVRRLVEWGQGSRHKKRADLQATNSVGKTALQLAESGDTPEHESIGVLLKRKMLLVK